MKPVCWWLQAADLPKSHSRLRLDLPQLHSLGLECLKQLSLAVPTQRYRKTGIAGTPALHRISSSPVPGHRVLPHKLGSFGSLY